MRLIDEGIDVEWNRGGGGIVSWTRKHEFNVDTSVQNNPTVDAELIPGVEVWSIFKRKKGTYCRDGNPLVHALKHEFGWKFKTENDERAVKRQFNKIAEKFVREHKHEIVILVPSSNRLNNYIVDVILRKEPDCDYMEGFAKKLTTEEVFDAVVDGNNSFTRKYANVYEERLNELVMYLKNMDKHHNGIFVRHEIKNEEMRNVLDRTLKMSDAVQAMDANKINGADLLIIDDTISRGQTIKEMVKLIQTSYSPKSITVLTLFSRI